MSRRLAFTVVVSLIVVIGIIVLARSRGAERWYYSRFRGAEPLTIQTERVRRLEAIRASLDRFRKHFDRLPIDEEEWAQSGENLEHLLHAPTWSDQRYHYRFSGIKSADGTDWAVLVDDPGITWPGWDDPAGESAALCRPQLFSDGSIRSRWFHRRDDGAWSYEYSWLGFSIW